MCGSVTGGILVFSIVIVFWGWEYFMRVGFAEEPLALSQPADLWVAELPVPLGFLLLFAQATCELKALGE